jgi:hypothetical protein
MHTTSSDNIKLQRNPRSRPPESELPPEIVVDDTVLQDQAAEPTPQDEHRVEVPVRNPMIHAVIGHALAHNPEFKHYSATSEVFTDFVFATPTDEHQPEKLFQQLRWGGQFVFVSPSARQVSELARDFGSKGFDIVLTPAFVRLERTGWRRFFTPAKRAHYFIARKVQLIPPGEVTDRFTYQVNLARSYATSDKYVVSKEVPSLESIYKRLKKRFPEAPDALLEKRARKFTDKIFPTFLTREAATLQILARDLPPPYNRRVPHVLELERDDRGFVRRMRMNWLRNGRKPISQMEFARQSADLLHVIHDTAKIMHLDLRLDNVVITDEGVGFVDFGSSVRVGEKLADNPLLASLFDELMRTSQIQHMLEKMTISGKVTSHAIRNGYKKVDKAVDFFYLAVQFNAPHSNPDLKNLITYDPESDEARALAMLTHLILQPPQPANPPFKSALDILRGIIEIQDHFNQHRRGQSVLRAR